MSDSDIKIVKKGWGYEKWIHNDKEYCGKLLVFEKNKKCSIHKHILKKETFYLNRGKMIIRYSYEEDLGRYKMLILKEGGKFEVPRGLYHQMEALEDSELFEFSTEHFDSDSYRLLKGD